MNSAKKTKLRGYLLADLRALGAPPAETEKLRAWRSRYMELVERIDLLAPRESKAEVIPSTNGVAPPSDHPKEKTTKRWRRCEVCHRSDSLTLHHFVPQAVGGKARDSVTLCRRCHKRAHAFWGPGDAYQGPKTAVGTLLQLRYLMREELRRETHSMPPETEGVSFCLHDGPP